MQMEKRVALDGPYGALANATDLPRSPQVASLLFEPKVLALNSAPTFERLPKSASIIEAPLPPPAAVRVTRDVPLPLSRPVSAPVVAAIAPPPTSELRTPRSQAHNGAFALPGVDSRTAVYDISARTVYLPGGHKLEAHSGLADKMDDPRFVSVKNRGPTPPNVYDLTLRERSFHGVQAIRLTPVDEGKMFGRDGILAHSYMLGPNGQSNGCVSFNNYRVFLQAFLRGEVDRLVVVARLPNSPSPALMSRRRGSDRFAANSY
jgi:Protein of unknown function (DUF2778)